MNNPTSTETAPIRVFLSYARSDDEPFVRRLHTDLTNAGFTVWFDRESLRSRGVPFPQEIKDAILKETDRLIYVGGPKAALSDSHSMGCNPATALYLAGLPAARRSAGTGRAHPSVPGRETVRRLRRLGHHGRNPRGHRGASLFAAAASGHQLLPGPEIHPGLSEHQFLPCHGRPHGCAPSRFGAVAVRKRGDYESLAWQT